MRAVVAMDDYGDRRTFGTGAKVAAGALAMLVLTGALGLVFGFPKFGGDGGQVTQAVNASSSPTASSPVSLVDASPSDSLSAALPEPTDLSSPADLVSVTTTPQGQASPTPARPTKTRTSPTKVTTKPTSTPKPTRPSGSTTPLRTTTKPPVRPTPSPTTQRPTSPKPKPTTPKPPAPAGDAAMAAEVIRLANVQRAKAGCSALTKNSQLTRAAQAHSSDMAQNNYFSHTSQDGRSPFDRIKAAGYTFSTAAENIAAGQGSAASVMDAWMNSSGHRANILNCGLKDIGVGVAKGGDLGIYWTQDFGTR